MVIIKIGGGEQINLQGIVSDLATYKGAFIIVHGANHLRDQLALQLGKPIQSVTSLSGYSSVLSDQTLIDLQMMAYAGLRNKRLVELLQQNEIPAIGLTGLDGALIRARRNKGIKVLEDSRKRIIRDFSGKPLEVNTKLLNTLMNEGYIPVITIPLIDENGVAVNSENDEVVALLQKSLNAEKVISFIEEGGYLADASDPTSVCTEVSMQQLLAWESNATGRIRRKLRSIIQLLNQETKAVILSDGRVAHPLKAALQGNGTVFR